MEIKKWCLSLIALSFLASCDKPRLETKVESTLKGVPVTLTSNQSHGESYLSTIILDEQENPTLCSGIEGNNSKRFTDAVTLINYQIQTKGIVELKGDYREDKTFKIKSVTVGNYTAELREEGTNF